MTERISSPEQLNSRLKINRIGIWIVLIALIVAIIVGLFLFLSHEIVVQESHLCYVSDVSKSSVDAMYDAFSLDPNYPGSVTREAIEEAYGKILEPFSQIAYFLIRDLDAIEIAEGMPLEVNNFIGLVASIPNELTDYEIILQSGINEKEMRKVGLMPGVSYYLVTAFIFSDEPGLVLDPGFYTATVTLDAVDPVSFILK